MTHDVPPVPRLLPWTAPGGKPCYLLSGRDGGPVAERADEVEGLQLDMGDELLGHAQALLGDPRAGAQEVRYLAAQLTTALGDALRVARSRGARLGAKDARSA
ncbi:hypothetical protein [Streptomyces kronopolitis]|uniref:hypothetical protein n=1 Tax=Streptomyces kronopolitis TaxID=1612435 RepID=UPI0034495D94